MQVQPKSSLTPQEYLARERQAETKSEYLQGEVFALAGASERHNLIVVNLVVSLGSQLKRQPCKVYANDMRVKAGPDGLYTYPDVVVVCGKAEFEDEHQDTLLNPTVIIEVLSSSTEAYDRGQKFAYYRTLDSLTDYLLVSQHEPLIEHYVRQPGGDWLLSDYRGLDAVVSILSIGCQLLLAEVYDKVEWSEDYDRSGMLKLLKETAAAWEGAAKMK